MSKEVYEKWKKREDAYDFDDKLLKTVRKLTPDYYKLIMLSVPEPRPWNSDIRAIAVFVKPWHLIAGYSNPSHIMVHDDYYHDHQDDELGEITIHFISINQWVTNLLDGDLDMYFAFRWWARSWFVDKEMREAAQQLMQFCMSKNTIAASIHTMRLEFSLLKKSPQDPRKFHVKLSRMIFLVGALKYLFRRKVMASDHVIATRFLDHEIVDDVLFAKYDNVRHTVIINYLKSQMDDIMVKSETSELLTKPQITYISGSVHHLRLMYAQK